MMTIADMLEEVLQNSCLGAEDEVVLMISSPGGSSCCRPKRVINILPELLEIKQFFRFIVPKMAKSAATMICLGGDAYWDEQNFGIGGQLTHKFL